MMDPRSVGSMKLKRRSISRSSAARVICALTSRTAFSMAAWADARSSLSWGPANAVVVAAKSAAHRARVLMGCSFSDRFVLLCAHCQGKVEMSYSQQSRNVLRSEEHTSELQSL